MHYLRYNTIVCIFTGCTEISIIWSFRLLEDNYIVFMSTCALLMEYLWLAHPKTALSRLSLSGD